MLSPNLRLLIAATLLVWAACTPKSSDRAIVDRPSEDLTLSVVGFYNMENLFDSDDDPTNKGDDEWLPTSNKRWTAKRYQEKLGRLANAVVDLGGSSSPGGPALLGVCEVENAKVLYDLAQQAALVNSNYGVIHHESPDYRGIDCAAIYRKDQFEVDQSVPIRVDLGLRDDGSQRVTRDILMIRGRLLGDSLTMFVNHWPSRRGGETASRPSRQKAAGVLKHWVDSLQANNPAVDIVLVGDFNDDPVSPSIRETLQAVDKRGDVGQTGLYNPMASLYRQGTGSLGYRDSWNLFDQIIVSRGMAEASQDWRFEQAQVMRKAYLLQPNGRYRGYPLRTYVGSDYRAGYSDHLPVYAILSKPRT